MGRYITYSDVVGDEGISGLEGTDILEVVVNKAIDDAETEVDRLVGNPIKIDYEIHIADGMREVFDLEQQGGVSEITRVTYNGALSRQPLPDDGSWAEDNESDWDSSGSVTVEDDSTLYVCKSHSIKATHTGAGTALYPASKNLRVIINGYNYFTFWAYCNTLETITIRLKRTDTDYLEGSITVPKTATYIYYSLPLGDMTEVGSIANVDRGGIQEINWIEFIGDGNFVICYDAICFAEYYSPLLDIGKIVWTDIDHRPYNGDKFEISYEIDIFNVVPDDVKIAAASLASATCWQVFAGKRYRKTMGVIRIDEATGKGERSFTFETIIKRYRQTGLQKLAGYIQGPPVVWTEEEEEGVYG